jgi:hypothetical protein
MRSLFSFKSVKKISNFEVYQIGRDDLKALEDFLGAKRFLFGDRPCNEDAMLFSFISQIVNLDQGPLNAYLTREIILFFRAYILFA